MTKEIKITFYADVEEQDYETVVKALENNGAAIITNELPELFNVGYFDVNVLREYGKE
ncbi:MAG: hypothetical protein J6M33_05310 [Anaerovibrio sp.]|nr:hypothetical protein [Anaerovibrio sp.]